MVSIRFPKKNSEEVIDYQLDNQSLIIIGANGSGKSHLAAFIEKKTMNRQQVRNVEKNV